MQDFGFQGLATSYVIPVFQYTVVAIFRGNKMEEECSHKGLKVEIRVGA
jgi:hypothetical protein